MVYNNSFSKQYAFYGNAFLCLSVPNATLARMAVSMQRVRPRVRGVTLAKGDLPPSSSV